MPAIGAPEYTQLIASTLQRIEPTLIDNIFTKHPTLDLLKKFTTSKTGRTLVMNVEAAEPEDTVVTDESGTFNTDVSGDFIGAVEYDWSKPYVGKTRQKWQVLQMNQGPEQLVDLAEKHIENMKKSHARRIVQGLHKMAGDVGAGEFFSLDQLISDAEYDLSEGITVGKVETHDGTTADTDSFWQATRYTSGRDSEDIRKAFRSMRNELLVNTNNDAEVSHVICGRNLFEELEDSFDDKVRYVDFGDGQTRFRAMYDGDIEVRLDPDAPADRAYFLDVSSWEFAHLNGNFMKVQPVQNIEGTLDFITPVASVFAFGVNERRKNGVLIRVEGTTPVPGIAKAAVAPKKAPKQAA